MTAETLSAASEELSPADFEFLRAIVRDRSAIVLEDGKEYLVQSRLAPLLRSEGLAGYAQLTDQVRRAPHGPLADKVVDAMTTNETSFFRDVHPFQALASDIIPDLLAAKGSSSDLTVWCGASSSGQEPYSLAITLREHFPQLAGRVRIVATDLSPTMVERCRDGRFSQLEVNRGLPAKQLVRYFEQDGNLWEAKPELREMIDARRLNLTDRWDGVPRCDLVMLRNVLIYFSHETKQEILARIRTDVLRPGGYLMLGASETTVNIDSVFIRQTFGRAACYQTPGPERGAPR